MHASVTEILVILLVALLVIKPKDLPKAAMTLGRALRWFRKTSAKIKNEITQPLHELSRQVRETEKITHE